MVDLAATRPISRPAVSKHLRGAGRGRPGGGDRPRPRAPLRASRPPAWRRCQRCSSASCWPAPRSRRSPSTRSPPRSGGPPATAVRPSHDRRPHDRHSHRPDRTGRRPAHALRHPDVRRAHRGRVGCRHRAGAARALARHLARRPRERDGAASGWASRATTPRTSRWRSGSATPPRTLKVTSNVGQHVWYLDVELSETDGVTTLAFSQPDVDREDALSVGPGWEYYLDRLVAVETGGDPGGRRLRARLLPGDGGVLPRATGRVYGVRSSIRGVRPGSGLGS